jgi:hypothetical protein
MKKQILAAAALTVAMIAAAAPAQAQTLIDLDCSLTAGCLFSGNITDEDASILATESSYNLLHTEPPLPNTLDLGEGLFKTPGSLGGTSGTFTLSGGGLFSFYAVKAGNQFMLYQVAPTNSVNWTTAGLVNGNGKLRDASHITVFGGAGAVPEPAVWAMMLIGFGGIGSALRRRKSQPVVQFA